jgi:phage tail tube protein FII
MPKIDEIITNYAVYEDAVEYLGMSEVTLPEVSMLTEEIKGAGIAGNVEELFLDISKQCQQHSILEQ